MSEVLDFVQRVGQDAGGTAAALEILLRVTVLLSIALLVALGLRRSSAALRHLVWTLSLIGTLLIPLFSWYFPAWRWAILPQPQQSPSPSIASAMEDAPLQVPLRAASSTGAPVNESFEVPAMPPAASVEHSTEPPLPRTTWSWSAVLAAVWAVGTSLALMRVGIGMVGAWHVTRRAERPPDPHWQQILQQLLNRCSFRRAIEVRQCPQLSVPMTWGLRRPVILVPARSAAWSAEMKRSVLLHELGHIRRSDCLVHLLGRLASAVYWFHPLAWLAARQLRKTSEQAADDVVLSSSIAPPDYAQHLVGIAGQMRGIRLFGHVALPMASPSDLEGRVLAILDPQRNHRSLKRKTCYALMVFAALLLIPCALLRLGYAQDKSSPAQAEGKLALPSADADPLTGTVLGLDGEPLADAEVFLATEPLIVNDRKASSNSRRKNRAVQTDAAGRFEFPPEVKPFYIVVLDDQGFAMVTEKQFSASPDITIQPWTAGEDTFQAVRRPALRTSSPTPTAKKAATKPVAKPAADDGPLKWKIAATTTVAYFEGISSDDEPSDPPLILPGYEACVPQAVWKALAISDEQTERLRKVMRDHGSEQSKFFRERTKDEPPGELTAAFEKWRQVEQQRCDKQMEEILTPQQMQTIRDRKFRYEAFLALGGGRSDERLGLSAKQRDQLRAISEAFIRQQEQMLRELTDKELAILTSQQRSKLREVAVGPLASDLHNTTVTLAVEGEADPIRIHSLDPYPDFSREEVQKELGLTTSQQNQVRDILGNSSTVTEKLLREALKRPREERKERRENTTITYGYMAGGGVSAEEIEKLQQEYEERVKEDRRARWAERQKQPLMQMTLALRKQFEAILTREQLAAYQDMAVRQTVLFALHDPIVLHQIEATEEQEATLRRMEQERRAERSQATCDWGQKMLAVLTPAQREKLRAEID